MVDKAPPVFLSLLRKITQKSAGKRFVRRLNEYLQRTYAQPHRKYLLEDFDQNLKIVVNLSDHILSHIFWNGYYSTDELKVAEKFIKPNSVVLDIGANIGEFTLFAAHRAQQGHVYAFEPSGPLFCELERNVELNAFSNVTCLQLGLSDTAGELRLFAIDEDSTDSMKNRGKGSLFAKDQRGKGEAVQLKKLDDWIESSNIKRLDVVKMDIEGAELMALKGATETLKKYKPVIVIEVNEVTCQRAGYAPKEIPKFLSALGYSIFEIGKQGQYHKISVDRDRFPRDILCIAE